MTNEEIAVRIQAGENGLMGELWEQNIGIFKLKANRLYALNRDRCFSAGVEYEDIVQVGYFALCDAVKAFQPDTGYKLMTYTTFPLKNHFNTLLGVCSTKRDALNQAISLNEPLGDDPDGDTTRIDMLADPDSEKAFEALINSMGQSGLRDTLEKSLSKLPEHRAVVIRGWLFEGKTQEQLATERGVSVTAVGALVRETLRTLTKEPALQSYRPEGLSQREKKIQRQKVNKKNWVSSVEGVVTKAGTLTEQRRESILNAIKKGGARNEQKSGHAL